MKCLNLDGARSSTASRRFFSNMTIDQQEIAKEIETPLNILS